MQPFPHHPSQSLLALHREGSDRRQRPFRPGTTTNSQAWGPMTRSRNAVDKVRVLPLLHVYSKAVSSGLLSSDCLLADKGRVRRNSQRRVTSPHLTSSTLPGRLTYTQHRACSLHPELIDSSLTRRHSSSHMGVMSPCSAAATKWCAACPVGHQPDLPKLRGFADGGMDGGDSVLPSSWPRKTRLN